MKLSQHFNGYLLISITCALITYITVILSGITGPTVLASSGQGNFFTDSTSYLTASPSQLNVIDCQTSNHQTWTCVLTLYAQNINNTIAWNTYTPSSGISINPDKGYFAKVEPLVQVTISKIPCMNSYFLFSGQVLGGGGVIPVTVTWSCIQKPTPIPQPSPTPKVMKPTSTPISTSTPRLVPTTEPSSTSVISPASHSDPPKGNSDPSNNILTTSALIFVVLEAMVALVLITLLIERKVFKR